MRSDKVDGQVGQETGAESVPADLTARAQIRDSALRLFADLGPDAVSVRQIAEQAGVSTALVLYHYGSKAGLRKAVDEHAARAFGDLLDVGNSRELARRLIAEGDTMSLAGAFAASFPPDSPLPAYLRRLLLSGDPVGQRLFRRWYEATLLMLQVMEEEGYTTRSDDPEVRAAFLLANDLALVLLRHPIEAALGSDPFSDAGLSRWAKEVFELYRDGVFPSALPRPEASEPTRGQVET